MTGGKGRVALACDHAGVHMKELIKEELAAQGFGVEDLGTSGNASVDYPDFAEAVARRVSENRAELGVLVCGTGIGMSIAANKFPGVRAAVLYDDYAARYARLHNDANVVCFGARTMTVEAVLSRLRAFLSASFEGGRHGARVDKIRNIEKKIAS